MVRIVIVATKTSFVLARRLISYLPPPPKAKEVKAVKGG